jgi:hypothetical protein
MAGLKAGLKTKESHRVPGISGKSQKEGLQGHEEVKGIGRTFSCFKVPWSS